MRRSVWPFEGRKRAVFLRVGWRQQQRGEHLRHILGIERPLGHRIITERVDDGIEGGPHQPARPLQIGRDVHHGCASGDRQLDNFSGASAAAGPGVGAGSNP